MLAAQMELRPPRDANIVAAQLVPRVVGNFDFPRMDQKSAAAVISCGRDVSNEFRGCASNSRKWEPGFLIFGVKSYTL